MDARLTAYGSEKNMGMGDRNETAGAEGAIDAANHVTEHRSDTEHPRREDAVTEHTATIGHVHLKVRDLERSVAFYRGVLGLSVTETLGDDFVFLSASDAHHELALQRAGGPADPRSPRSPGLYHTAWEVPDDRAFASAYRTLLDAGVAVQAVDHGISRALYFSDPDGNGVEIYLDRRAEPGGTTEWRGRSRRLGKEMILGGSEK